METYCVSCKNTANKNSSVKRTKQNRLMLMSNYAFCDKKKTRFIKNEEASELLSSILPKLPTSDIPVAGPVFG